MGAEQKEKLGKTKEIFGICKNAKASKIIKKRVTILNDQLHPTHSDRINRLTCQWIGI